MNNKNTIKEILEEKINKQNVYDTVIQKKENRFKNRSKWIAVPICICIFVFFITIEKQEVKYQKNENNNSIEITAKEEEKKEYNYTNSNGHTSSEDTLHISKETNEKIVFPFKITLPNNIIEKQNFILYLQEEICGYQKVYENNNQSIIITIFTDKRKKAEGKTFIHNNIEYVIHKTAGSANRFIVQWDYNEQMVNMETINVEEEDIIKILKTIGEKK